MMGRLLLTPMEPLTPPPTPPWPLHTKGSTLLAGHIWTIFWTDPGESSNAVGVQCGRASMGRYGGLRCVRAGPNAPNTGVCIVGEVVTRGNDICSRAR